MAEGDCFRIANRFVMDQDEGELVHGTIFSSGKRIQHAWVDLGTGYIWEPITGSYIPEDFWIENYSAQEEARYSPEEAAVMAVRTMNFGPWTRRERKEAIG